MTSSHDLDIQKQDLRKQALAQRMILMERYGVEAASVIATDAEAYVKRHEGVVAGYWPLEGELDPRPLMERLAAAGRRLALPVVAGPAKPLAFRQWTKDEALEMGAHGTWHPKASSPEISPEIVLVPLLAFDRDGVRLGFGGGYYDRTLEALRRKGPVLALGLAFAGQEAEALPRDRHDQILDMIFTEDGPLVPRGLATRGTTSA